MESGKNFKIAILHLINVLEDLKQIPTFGKTPTCVCVYKWNF